MYILDTEKRTLRNLASYLYSKKRPLFGPLGGETRGGFSTLYKKDRQFFILYHIEGDFKRLYVDVYPQCICDDAYRNLVHSFLDYNLPSNCPVRVIIENGTGEIFVRSEITIHSSPAEMSDIVLSEKEALTYASALANHLDKLCDGIHVDFDDYDLIDAYPSDEEEYDDEEYDEEYEKQYEDEATLQQFIASFYKYTDDPEINFDSNEDDGDGDDDK